MEIKSGVLRSRYEDYLFGDSFASTSSPKASCKMTARAFQTHLAFRAKEKKLRSPFFQWQMNFEAVMMSIKERMSDVGDKREELA